MRIGQSSDIHQLAAGRKLILGGVEIPHEKGLVGHSDADALVHAVAEAILGALAWEGVSSLIILKEVARMMQKKGYHIGNVDALVMIERPKMASHIMKMRENIASCLHTDIDNVSVKATRGEKLGFVGREEGVLAQAVVLLEENR